MLYASALTDGVHNLMVMESDPGAGAHASRHQQTRRDAEAARGRAREFTNPPRIFAERALGSFRGAHDLLGKDLDLAFASDPNRALRDSVRSPPMPRFVK
jgi:hypothetical protein